MADENEIEVEDTEPEFITPPSNLKDKIATGGANAVDTDALARAEEVIANMADSYLDWVEEDLNKIQGAYDRLVAGEGDRTRDLEKVFAIAHDMKGQGGSFGFDLVTAVGNHLCRLLERIDDTTKPQTQNEAIRIHIDAMKLVISNRMRGDGGAQGSAILSGIQMMADKLIPPEKT